MTSQNYHDYEEEYCFKPETMQLIEYYENVFQIEQVHKNSRFIGDRIQWVKELISEYDTTEADYNYNIRISKRNKDYNVVCKTLSHGKLPDEIKRSVLPSKYKNIKRCDVKKITRVIHLLKIAQSMGKKAFHKFILIPDVNYILSIIEKDSFGDLKYLFTNVA